MSNKEYMEIRPEGQDPKSRLKFWLIAGGEFNPDTFKHEGIAEMRIEINGDWIPALNIFQEDGVHYMYWDAKTLYGPFGWLDLFQAETRWQGDEELGDLIKFLLLYEQEIIAWITETQHIGEDEKALLARLHKKGQCK